MNLTNKFNLPEPIYRAVKFDPYKRVGDISVTALIKSPRMVQLERRYSDEITEDVSERIWALLGQSIHVILERAAIVNSLAEERLTAGVLGWTISGQPDLMEGDHTLTDYKVVGVMTVTDGLKSEYIQQIQLYAWLYGQNGFEIRKAQVVAIFRDWMRSRATRESDYPQSPVAVLPVELWSPEAQEKFVTERVLLHQKAEKLVDEELPLCTDEERWAKPEMFAVKKKGNKRAYRVLEKEEEAFSLLAELGDKFEIEHRPGSFPRCADYCKVWALCAEGRKIHESA